MNDEKEVLDCLLKRQEKMLELYPDASCTCGELEDYISEYRALCHRIEAVRANMNKDARERIR